MITYYTIIRFYLNKFCFFHVSSDFHQYLLDENIEITLIRSLNFRIYFHIIQMTTTGANVYLKHRPHQTNDTIKR